MTIYGSNHMEWPTDYEKEIEMELDKEFEEWLWEKTMEGGPPQSDDLLWVKLETMKLWLATAAILYPDGVPVESGNLAFLSDEALLYFETVWDDVESRLEEI